MAKPKIIEKLDILTESLVGDTDGIPIVIPNGFMLGDVNGDGVITDADVTRIKHYVANQSAISAGRPVVYPNEEIEGRQLISADVNKDGTITNTDATRLTRFLNDMPTNSNASDDINGIWTRIEGTTYNSDAWNYVDIPIGGLLTTNNISLDVAGTYTDVITKAEIIADGVLRVYAKNLPLRPIHAIVDITKTEGTGIVSIINQQIRLQPTIRKTDVTLTASSFVANTDNEDFPYKVDIAITNATADHIPTVIFSEADALSGNFSPICDTVSGKVTIYAKEPIDTTIPLIYLQIAEVTA